MPFINVKLIEGVFSSEQKAQIIRKLTDTMVEIEGEGLIENGLEGDRVGLLHGANRTF